MNMLKPEILAWLWLLPVVAGLLAFGYRRRQRRLATYAGQQLKALLSAKPSRSREVSKGLLILTALACLVVSLTRPRWGFSWREMPQGGRDIMVVLDLSTSMLAEDLTPNRLERAKRELIDLLAMLQGDRFGVVVFAGVAFVQCPLTVDYRLARLFTSQLSIDMMPRQGTALGEAIRVATTSLTKGASADSQGKAILLITDGEDLEQEALTAADAAKAAGIKIYAIGIGSTEGAPIPMPGGGYKKDAQGNMVISRLDAATLEEIASRTGGAYVRSTTGDMDLELIYQQGIKGSLAVGETGSIRQKIWFERYQWFVAAAFFLLLLEWLLPAWRRKVM